MLMRGRPKPRTWPPRRPQPSGSSRDGLPGSGTYTRSRKQAAPELAVASPPTAAACWLMGAGTATDEHCSYEPGEHAKWQEEYIREGRRLLGEPDNLDF